MFDPNSYTLSTSNKSFDQLTLTIVASNAPREYSLATVVESKKYQLVYEKQVIHPNTFKTYPYVDERITNEDVDIL